MATEPTLGWRIRDALADGAQYTFSDPVGAARWDAIMARAAAAERLAVALSPLGLHICDDEPGADEVNAAMEAWWVIEGKVQP